MNFDYIIAVGYSVNLTIPLPVQVAEVQSAEIEVAP